MASKTFTPKWFQARIREVEDEQRALDTKLEWLTEGYRRLAEDQATTERVVELIPDSSVYADSRPPLRQAIQIVMNEDTRQLWRAADLLMALELRGWQPLGS